VIAQQSTRAQRLAAADATLFNEGLPLDQLEAQVEQVWQHFGLSS
jgi:dephospho-CoA kinase